MLFRSDIENEANINQQRGAGAIHQFPCGPNSDIALLNSGTIKSKTRHNSQQNTDSAHPKGMVLFVKGALPNETVHAEIVELKKSYAVAKLLEVLKPSPDRNTHYNCAVANFCGGCDLAHLKYEKQLEFKQDKVKEALLKFAGVENAQIDSITPSKLQQSYRNKVTMHVKRGKDNKVYLGYYEESTNCIIGTKSCSLASRLINRCVETMANHIEATPNISITEITVRELENTLLVTLFVRSESRIGIVALKTNESTNTMATASIDDASEFTNLEARLKQIFKDNLMLYTCKQKGHLQSSSINKSKAQTPHTPMQKKTYQLLYSNNKKELKMLGLKIKPSAASFYQVNDSVASALYEDVIIHTKSISPEVVIDAYCGAGLLTAKLASCATKAVGLEIVPEAISSANELVKQNGINNCKFILGDCATTLPKAMNNAKDALVVLDPPRAGCHKKVIRVLSESLPSNIVYISCEPSTLARDLKLLLPYYNLTRIKLFDMFPQTSHIETLVFLKRK